eukprot:8043096-Alexandrium_andersonii.AAC.1
MGLHVAVAGEVPYPGSAVPGWAALFVVGVASCLCLGPRPRLSLHIAVFSQVPLPAKDVRGQVGDPGPAIPC